MALSWRVRKQLSYLFAVILFFGAIAGFFIWRQLSGGTCFDNRQNQGETGIDCGGPCDPCPINLKEPLVLWARFFPINGNMYDAAALVENLNQNWGSRQINYNFKLYDEDNILIVEQDGVTFLNPRERALIFKSGFQSGQRTPARAVLEIEPVKNWKYTEKIPPRFIIAKKEFDINSSLLTVEIKNDTFSDINDIYVGAVLLNKENNVFAASATKVDGIAAGASAEAAFTWRETFQEEPDRIKIFTRVNVMK